MPKFEYVVTIEATFPELRSAKAVATGRGSGSTQKVAIARAGANLLKHQNVRRKRFTRATATLSFGRVEVE